MKLSEYISGHIVKGHDHDIVVKGLPRGAENLVTTAAGNLELARSVCYGSIISSPKRCSKKETAHRIWLW